MTALLEGSSKSTNPVIVNPFIKHKEIVERIAIGETLVSIAKDYGVTQQRISQLKKEYEPEIELARAILLDRFAPTFIKRTILEEHKALVIAERDDIPTKDEEPFMVRINKAGVDAMKSTGIYSAGTINNNFGDDNSQHLTVTPAFQDYLDHNSKQKLDPGGEEIKEAETD